MRLLNVNTLRFKEFTEGEAPHYAILSHRWGDGEVSYKDYCKNQNTERSGYHKIAEFCAFVRETLMLEVEGLERCEDGPDWQLRKLEWAWVDTCCIDKRSSAELSEAINSMFRWYKNAEICIAYLSDVDATDQRSSGLRQSSWFSRGWTLQELLAPRSIVFCDSRWRILGHVCKSCGPLCETFRGPLLTEELSQITGIQSEHLRGFNPQITGASIAQRMNWASRRETTRPEDEAYSLLGLFDVNMPLIYGEGRRAFLRLQEEIVRRTTDQSIFAWRVPRYSSHLGFGLLAWSPRVFSSSGNIMAPSESYSLDRPFAITNNGVEFIADISRNRLRSDAQGQETRILNLNCVIAHPDGKTNSQVRITLGPIAGTKNHFVRVFAHDLGETLDSADLKHMGEKRFYVPAYLDRPFLIAPR